MFSKAATRQLITAFIGGLSLFCSGMSFTWVTPLLSELKSPDSEVPLTADQASWMVSLIEIGNLFTPIPAGFLVDRWGRKPCLLFPAILYVATWIMVIYVKSVPSLYVMRIVQGMGMSVQYTILPMYLAEIAGPSRRGALSSFFQGMWYLGVLYEYSIGAFFGFNGLTWFSIGPPIVFMAIFSFCPESPYFLLMRGRTEEAKRVLAWLRGLNLETIAPELKAIEDTIQEERKEKGSWKDIVGTANGRRALVIALILGTTEIMSGLTTVLSYVTDTFAQTSGDPQEADLVTIFLGVTLILVTLVSACLSDRLGRRPLLIGSGYAGALTLGATSAFYYISEYTTFDTSLFKWLPYITIILFMNLMSFGIGSLIPALQSELFPNSTRGIACGISTFWITFLSFICLKMYQVIGDNIGYCFNYALFTIFTFFGTTCIFFLLPETKGKTFSEIQEILHTYKK